MIRTLNVILLALFLVLSLTAQGRADDQPLNRAEVTVIKHKLVAVEEALGAPPAGYAKAEEHFELPTSISTRSEGGGFYPVYSSANLRFDGGADKQSKKSQQEIEAEYRKKMLEAQAAGNYEAMSTIAQEMMQKMSQAQMAAEEARRVPISIILNFNTDPGATIDPDAVVFEKPGVIALKNMDGGDEENLRIAIYIDPVHLKETKTLSRVDLSDNPDQGVTEKTTIRNLTIEMTGPAQEVEAWSKRIDTDKALAQIDTK
jgi:hypothetical protein